MKICFFILLFLMVDELCLGWVSILMVGCIEFVVVIFCMLRWIVLLVDVVKVCFCIVDEDDLVWVLVVWVLILGLRFG